MAKFKCLKECKSKETGDIYKPGVVYDLTVKHVDTMEKNIDAQKKFKGSGPYFERVDEPVKKETKADAKDDAKVVEDPKVAEDKEATKK